MNRNIAFVLLHFIILLWGFTAILGNLISYQSVPMVWWRLIIVCITLGVFFLFSKKKLLLNSTLFIKIALVGFVVGLHWLCFYGGIKASNISITMIAFSSGTFFTSLIEPYIYKRKIQWNEVGIGLAIFATIGCIGYSQLDTIKNPWLGVLYGIAAAFTASVFSTCNGTLIQDSNAFNITFIELVSAFVWISLGLLFFFEVPDNLFSPSTTDLIYLFILAIACTAVPFIISVEIMKELTPFTINLSLNLEIVYSIVMAYFIFEEEEKMTPTFYWGTLIIFILIISNEIIKKRKIKHQKMIY